MEGGNNSLNIFIGRDVKLVVKEPGDEHTKVIFGTVEAVIGEFLLFKSKHGVGTYNLRYVVAIKPTEGSNERN